MHSGGGSSNVVSVAPATPIIKNMIGIAALVLEGRERSAEPPSIAAKSKDPFLGYATGVHVVRLPVPFVDSPEVAVAMSTTNSTTASGTTSNWARSHRLSHIYRLKNRLLVGSTGGQPQPVDYDLEAGSQAAFEPQPFLEHMLTGSRVGRQAIPRSWMEIGALEKRQASSSSSSSSGSSGGAAGGAITPARRNSRSSPVPVIHSIGGRTHCDDFLRTIGLLKGSNSSSGVAGATPVVGKLSPGMAVNKSALFVGEDEQHHCDEFVSSECYRWQQFLRKIETLLCRGSSICIEVSLGPEAHPLLLEQWIIQRVESPSQPSMTIQSLCSAIRSQLHFSQISSWSDLLEQQYTDYSFYQEHILKNPRITLNRATSRPELDLLYRVKCATQKATFDQAPVVHNFPNVILDASTGLAVSLRSLPRLERIPRLNVENKKSDMMEATVVESEIIPSPLVMAQQQPAHMKGALWSFAEKKSEGESSSHAQFGSSSDGASSAALSHREKQLLKYKKRLMRRDKGHGVSSSSGESASPECPMEVAATTTSINDLMLPPLYTDLDANGDKPERPATVRQDVGTQTDLQLTLDDEIVEMEVEGEEEQESVACQGCDKILLCPNCDTGPTQRYQKLKEKYRNALVAKRSGSGAARVFYKIPKSHRANNHLWSTGAAAKSTSKAQESTEDNNNVAGAVNRNVQETDQESEAEDGKAKGKEDLFSFTSLCDYSEMDRQAAESPTLFVSWDANGCHLTPQNEQQSLVQGQQKNTNKRGEVAIDASFNTMKLCKLDHDTVSLKTGHHQLQPPSSSEGNKSSVTAAVIKSSVHCVKNLSAIFSNATEAAAAALVKPPTPQVMLRKLNLYTAAVSAKEEDVFNFDLSAVQNGNGGGAEEGGGEGVDEEEEQEEDEDEDGGKRTSPRRQFLVKKSFSTPSASVASDGQANGEEKTANSLSPRFLKSASQYNKKQKRRSRHLSDRSSERSSVCSDELSLSDDETLLLTPNGSNLLLTQSPVMPTRRPIVGADGKVVAGGAGGVGRLFKSVFGQRPLLGSIEESLLQRRLTPKFQVSGFRVLLGASGTFCPKQLTIPAKTFFYELSGQSQTTPYMAEVRLPRKGYTVPRNGTVQVTLLNPLGTFVHMFVVAYDFRDMPPMATTFVRQRTLMVEEEGKEKEGRKQGQKEKNGDQMRLLRYVIHLRFQTTRSGRLVLHSDIRMLINRRTDHDTAAAHAKGALESPNELKTITIMPENPRFSERIDKV